MKDLNPDLFDLFRLVSTINLPVLVRLAFAGSDMQENLFFSGSETMLRSGGRGESAIRCRGGELEHCNP